MTIKVASEIRGLSTAAPPRNSIVRACCWLLNPKYRKVRRLTKLKLRRRFERERIPLRLILGAPHLARPPAETRTHLP